MKTCESCFDFQAQVSLFLKTSYQDFQIFCTVLMLGIDDTVKRLQQGSFLGRGYCEVLQHRCAQFGRWL